MLVDQALAASLLRHSSIPTVPTAIATIAMTPPSRLLVDVLAGCIGGTIGTAEPESIVVGVLTGVSTPVEVAGAVWEAGTVVAAGAAWVVVWPAAVVAALVATAVVLVVAGTVVAGAWVVAACLGGVAPGATYPPPAGS